LMSVEGNSKPWVLIDGIPMDINDVDPEDIASVSVLKDAAASAIYGARAAYGVILITTKKGSTDGKVTFSYSGNYARSTPTNWPDLTNTMSFAHAMNEGRTNMGAAPWLDDERLANLAANIANPGSAPEWYENSAGTNWDQGSWGIKSSGDYDWGEIMFDDSSPRTKHNLSASGGSEKVNFYISGGFFSEDGIMRHGKESFKRFNVDAKVNAEATSWLDLSLLVKYKQSKEDFPWSTVGISPGTSDGGGGIGRGRIFDALTKIKPTMVPYYPDSEVWNLSSRIGAWATNRDVYVKRQLVLSPRMVIEPIENWKTSIDFNYVTNDNRRTFSKTPTIWLRPDGSEDVWPGAQSGTVYRPEMYTNDYFQPTIRSEYTKSFADHNFGIMVGYSHEEYNYNNLGANGAHLLSDNAL
ncbi:MAG: TonB-dependent receptor plug domain-containing protein, partial [Cyclobacteriaceae bacterium]|nr:TonB-dependent receptor plug domain-containing protein [Cyclobacteriaceae bacterium]